MDIQEMGLTEQSPLGDRLLANVLRKFVQTDASVVLGDNVMQLAGVAVVLTTSEYWAVEALLADIP